MWRTDVQWLTQQPLLRQVDPHNEMGWRHSRPGPWRQWETILVEMHGDTWFKVFDDPQGKELWARCAHDAICKWFDSHGLRSPWSATAVSSPVPRSPATISVPCAHLLEVQPYCGARFRLHFDSELVAGWLSGSFRCKTMEMHTLAGIATEHLWRTCRHTDWCFAGCSWVKWVPRSQNVLADWLANMAVECRASFHWQADGNPDLAQYFVVGYADGACKGATGVGASGYALLGLSPQKGHPKLLLAGAKFWEKCTAIQAEMAGAAYLAKSMWEIASHGRARVQHESAPIELDWRCGLHQLEMTLSSNVVVAGQFESNA